jgi:hypothetical protein
VQLVDEDAVPAVGQVEKGILVGLLGARAGVLVDGIDRLPVLDERSKRSPRPSGLTTPSVDARP